MAWVWKCALCYLFACCCVILCATGLEGEPCEVTILGPNPQFVEFGSPVFLNCTTTCNNSAHLEWETSLRKHVNKSRTWTTISSTMDQWATTPKCFIIFSVDNIISGQTSVVAYQPPKDVRINMPQVMEVGRSYDLTCDVENVAPKRNLIVLIIRGNETLHVESYASDQTNKSTNVTVTYGITAQREDHKADYTCLALLDLRPNVGPFEKSSNATVHVISLPEDPKIEVLSVIDKGSDVITKCEVANAFPIDEVEIELILEGQVLNITKESRSGDVRIVEAVVTAAESGEYLLECRAIIGDLNTAAEKQLLVFSFPAPVLEILRTIEDLSVGSEVNVTCTIVETYPREVRLSIRIGSRLEACEWESSRSCTYRLSVQREHNAVTVTCEAALDAINMTKRSSATLNVVYAPEFTNRLCPGTQTIVEGHNATFSCKADGNPTPTIKCSKDENVDTWRKIGRNDSGSFKCTAENSVGDSVQLVNVTVEYKPTITLLIQGPEKIEKGHNLTLECLADGLLAPEYIWTTPTGADIIYSSDNRTLTIVSAASHHSGTYTCEARNRQGSDIWQKEIQVSDILPLILGMVVGAVALAATAAGGVVYYLWNRARKIQKYELQKSNQKEKKPATQDSLL